MGISKKIQQTMEQGSWIRKMFEEGIALKRQFGEENVFDLSLGNPIMEPPQEFFEELRRIAENPTPGMHRYMPNAGYVETRAAVASQLREETGLEFTADEILMTCGAGGGLNVVLKTLLDPGDEVVIFAPYFVEYHFYADNHGGTCRVVPPDDNFLPDLQAFEAAINPKTKAVLISSPNNPTGVVYPASLLDQMAGIIRTKEGQYGTEIFLVSDEPYRKILFDGLQYPHIFLHHLRSIVATSHSKDLALPGERIGYVAVHPGYVGKDELVEGLTFCNRTLGFVNAPALMQHIVKKLQSVVVDIEEYHAKRDFLYGNLTDMGYSAVKPQGAFYLFPRSPIDDDLAFVDELRKHNVLVVPGRGFGLPGYFRISYCVDDRTLKGSLEGFRLAMENFKGS
ncbi:MAG: pyridoxal phosphate-dependent aminotransferase [SAR202 cluster bacterium]|nr:pyridoxal phosphate-dependent aminotransferase [SAR202 cluster bacterium]